ncbi:MAG TPA: WD40 repeat domain-containing protein, partial [Chloroflexia bacterium]|nr:WD40 repeat domain-containing protein [Chloroflexia bacterium]
MQQDDLRDAIVEPARKSVLFFDPEDAVDALIHDLGPALPGVSRPLSELETKTWQRWQAGDRSRVLKYDDYLDMGSISGVLGRQAEAVYEEFGQPAAAGSPESGSSAPGEPGKKQAIMQRVLLRMIDTDDASAEYGVRSVPLNELDYDTDQDVREVVERLAEAHLLVIGRHRTGEAYAMPAHPKLIQGWQRVREWHAAAETVLPLRLHRKLTRDAQDWHRTPPGRPEWLLWAGGSNLTGVEHTLTVAPERLNQLERDFARAGVALRERNERARKRRMMALVGLTITSLIAAVIAWLFAGEAQLQTRQAQREARAARVGQLTSEARSRVNNYPVQSLLISLEAITTTMNVGEPPLPVAQEMLYSSLSRVGGRGLSGHASSISALAISSDSRWLASASTDATIHLWDLTSPNPIAESVVLSGVTQPSTKLVFSPDSKRLLAKSNEQALLWHLEDTAGPLAPVVLRANVVAGRPPNAWGRTAFSPDSRWLSIFGGRTEGYTVKTVPGEAYLYMWDLSSDEVVAEGLALPLVGEYPNPGTYPPPPGYLPDEPPPVGPYPFIPTAIPTVGEYPNTYIAYAPTPQANPDTYPAYAPTPGDGLVQSTPGPMQASGDNPVDTLQAEQQFTLDSRWLYALLPSGIALWDLNDLSLPPVRLTDSAPTTVSANGRWAIVPSGGGIMELWDLGSLSANSVPQRFSLPTDGQPMVEPPTLSISPDGRWLAVRWLSTSGVENLSVWDFTAEALASSERILVRETAERQRPIDKFSFSPDSRWLFVSRPNSSMQRWSLEVPGLLPVEVRGSAQLLGFNVSGNGRWMVGVRSNLPNPSSTFALLWDLDNVGIAQSNTVLEGHDSWLDTTHAVFSADNRWLAIGDYNGMVRLWELTTPPSPALPIPLLPNGRGEFANVTLKPSSNELVTIDGKTMRVWNLASREPGLEPHTFKLGFEGRDELLSPDIRWLVFQSRKDQNQLDLNLLDLTAADPGASIR